MHMYIDAERERERDIIYIHHNTIISPLTHDLVVGNGSSLWRSEVSRWLRSKPKKDAQQS